MKSLSIFSVLIVALMMAQPVFGKVEISPHKLFKLGDEAYEAGKYEEAIQLLKSSIEQGLSGKELREAYLTIGGSYYRIRKFDLGTHYFIKSEDLRWPRYKHAAVALLCEVYTEDEHNSENIKFDIPHAVSGSWSGYDNRYPNRNYHTVRSGNLKITFDKFGYDTSVLEVNLKPGELVKITEPVVLRKTTSPIEYVSATGKIIDEYHNKPMPGVEVRFYLRPSGHSVYTKSDSSGNYHSDKLPKGQYWIYFDLPTHSGKTLSRKLTKSHTTLPSTILYRTKDITLKYIITQKGMWASPKFDNAQSPAQILLKTSESCDIEVQCGFNFVEEQTTGDWYSRGDTTLPPPHVYFRQDAQSLTISNSRSEAVKLGRIPWNTITDPESYDYSRLGLASFDIGDIFLFNINDGELYAKLQILDITDRQDTPQTERKD